MDGPLCAAVITSGVVVAGAIGGGFWRVLILVGRQDKSIGRMEGKIDGLDTTMQNFQSQLNGVDERIGRIDNRINGLTNKRE